MSPTERRRPTTRRKRIAHLGVGGILAAVAGAQTAALTASPHQAVAATPPQTIPEPDPPAPHPTATRSHAHHRPHPKAPHAAAVAVPAVWRAVAACESGGNWRDTVGTFEGGLQFLNSTWLADGGGRYAQHAYDATPAEQLEIARVALTSGGPGQWPVCSRVAGLTRANGLA